MTAEYTVRIDPIERFAVATSNEPKQGPAYVGVFTPRISRTATGVSNYPDYPNAAYVDGTRVCKSAPGLLDNDGNVTANGRVYPGDI